MASAESLAEERERRRIAAELHDGLLQILAVTNVKLGALRESLSSTPEASQVDEIRTLIDEGIVSSRSLVSELSPPLLYDLGFEAAVELLAEHFSKQHNMVCEVEDDRQPKPLNDDTRVMLFQSVRESRSM